MVNRARLISGFVLFAFLTGHLLNHAFGVVSIAAAESALRAFYAVWGNPVSAAILALAFAAHIAAALIGLYRRRALRLRGWELAQTVLGFLIPVLLVGHVVGTRVAAEVHGVGVGYAPILLAYWGGDPVAGSLHAAVVLIAWAHGCIGLRFWLLTRTWFPGWRTPAAMAAFVLPAMALAGYVSAGAELRRALAADPLLADAILAASNRTAEIQAWGAEVTQASQLAFLGAIAAVLLARRVREIRHRRVGAPVIRYGGDRTIQVPPGATALEAIRQAGIPHASVCGGRGRCSTCRVRVRSGLESLTLPQPAEQRVLARIRAGGDIRLACQIRPVADLEIEPLLPASTTLHDALARPGYLAGDEREIAVLFADLRDFTRLSDGRLPYDVVYLLNRYFAAMGHTIEASGGRIDKFIGDGVMALFGVERGAGPGARSAIEAVHGLGRALEALNASLADELDRPLRLAIGVHAGPAIVGEMGHGRARSLTAIGDVVNVASRLEGLAKERNAAVVLSETVLDLAQVDAGGLEREAVTVRGKTVPVPVRVAASFAEIDGLVGGSSRPWAGLGVTGFSLAPGGAGRDDDGRFGPAPPLQETGSP